MWQTKYALAIPKNLGVGVNFGRAVKAISSLGVHSPCIRDNDKYVAYGNPMTSKNGGLGQYNMVASIM